MHRLRHVVARWLGLIFCIPLVCATPATAQENLSNAQLDQLLAPIALYPDALLSQVLMASTYPADVAAAAQWSRTNPSLSGDPAVRAVASEPWDPSVQSLAAFPSVLDLMGRQPQWVQQVGDAFLDQPNDVMDSVQRLRRQAAAAGSLKSNEQQRVVMQGSGPTTIVQIEPANPQVVYVPQYNPTVVYGPWPYPAYPPAYYPPPPGSVFATALVAGIGFGIGVAAVNSMWGGFGWGSHDVNINVNRYNNINVNNRLNVNSNNARWQHNAANRGNVPYNNAAVRGRYDQQRQAGLANRQAGQPGQRPGAAGGGALSQRDNARDRAAQSFQGRTGQAIPGHAGAPAGQGGNLAGRENAGRENRPGAGGGGQQRPAGADRQRADQAQARDRARQANQTSALRDAGNGDRMRQQTQRANFQNQPQRGNAQNRAAAPQHAAPQRAAPQRPAGGAGGGGRAAAGAGGGGGHLGHGRR